MIMKSPYLVIKFIFAKLYETEGIKEVPLYCIIIRRAIPKNHDAG